jgi:hypothetical protein
MPAPGCLIQRSPHPCSVVVETIRVSLYCAGIHSLTYRLRWLTGTRRTGGQPTTQTATRGRRGLTRDLQNCAALQSSIGTQRVPLVAKLSCVRSIATRKVTLTARAKNSHVVFVAARPAKFRAKTPITLAAHSGTTSIVIEAASGYGATTVSR